MRIARTSLARMLVVSVAAVAAFGTYLGCAPRPHMDIPEEDLTPYERLVRAWTGRHLYRRTTGGDDLVSERDAVIQRPTHEERLLIEATLYADTLVSEEIEQLVLSDTLGIGRDSIRTLYGRAHNWPEMFRVHVRAVATLSEPFQLEGLTIFIRDQNEIDYEPARTMFTPPVFSQRTYLDTEVTRYDPYSRSEYQVYNYRQGYEYQSRGLATLYFPRTNVIGADLLNTPGARLTLVFQRDRRKLGDVEWDIEVIRRELREDRMAEIR